MLNNFVQQNMAGTEWPAKWTLVPNNLIEEIGNEKVSLNISDSILGPERQ